MDTVVLLHALSSGDRCPRRFHETFEKGIGSLHLILSAASCAAKIKDDSHGDTVCPMKTLTESLN